MSSVTFLLAALTTVTKQFGEIALNKVREHLLGTVDKRSALYSLIKSELTDINESLKNIVGESLKTAITYYLFALNTDDKQDFLKCEQESIKAFHVVNNIRDKCSAICLAIYSIISLYDDQVACPKIRVLMNLFIEDKCVMDLFSRIHRKKYDDSSFGKHITIYMVASIFTIAALPIVLPIRLYTNRLIVDSYVCENFFVKRMEFCRYSDIKSIMYGVTKNSCQINGRLMIIDMQEEMADIDYVDKTLSAFAKMLKITDKFTDRSKAMTRSK